MHIIKAYYTIGLLVFRLVLIHKKRDVNVDLFMNRFFLKIFFWGYEKRDFALHYVDCFWENVSWKTNEYIDITKEIVKIGQYKNMSQIVFFF